MPKVALADPCSFENGGCDSLAACIPDQSAQEKRRCGACPSGYEGDGFSCIDLDECATSNGGCDPLVTCINTPGGRTCGPCPSGYFGNGDTTFSGGGCSDIDECATANGGCDPLTTCTNALGEPRVCGPCPDGYIGSGDTACQIAPDSCSASPNGGCDRLTTCKDTPQGPECGACPPGYAGTGTTACIDVDACAGNSPPPCYPGVDCIDVNAPGLGFVCGDCPGGMYGDGKECFADACFTLNGGCSSLVECTNNASTPSGRTCGACPAGYESIDDGVSCTDVDSCSSSPCFPGVSCTDIKAPGQGRVCGKCPAGYNGDGIQCVDIDECLLAAGNGGCDARTTCTNLPGGRKCGPCPDGFRGTGETACTPITSCTDNNGGCHELTVCTDTPDGSSCGPCPPGFSGNGTLGCVDIDGCADDPCFPGSICSDVAAPELGYTCGPCPEGYAGNGDVKSGGTCELCTTSASIAAMSIAKGQLLRTQDLRVVAEAGKLSTGCTNNLGFIFRWDAITTNKGNGATIAYTLTDHVNFRNTKTLFVPRGTLPADAKATFAFTASLRGEPKVSASVVAEAFVSRAQIVAKIAGGGSLTGEATPIVLDASLSSDPDDAPGELRFSWACSSSYSASSSSAAVLEEGGALSGTSSSGGFCYNSDGSRAVLPKLAALPPMNLLGGLKGNPLRYYFTVTVSKGQRHSSESTIVTVEKGNPPAVSITPLELAKPNPSQSLKLIGNAQSMSTASTQPLTLSWAIFDETIGEWVDLAQPGTLSSTNPNAQYLSLKPNALIAGHEYAVLFEGSDSTGKGSSWLNFTMNTRPDGGKLVVEADHPLGSLDDVLVLNTTLKLTCSNFSDADEPLLFSFTAVKKDGSEVILRDFSPLTHTSKVIPISGEAVVIRCYAKDVFGAMSEAASADIAVKPPPADEMEAVANTAVSAAERALANGDSDDALTYLEGASKLLPGESSSQARDQMADTLLATSAMVIPSTESISRVTSAAASIGGAGDGIETSTAGKIVSAGKFTSKDPPSLPRWSGYGRRSATKQTSH